MVYTGIPRTGSKSMFQWLSDNYGSENVGGHHDWQVPDEFKDYLVVTIVRNPYERTVSGWFFEPVIKTGDEPPRPKSLAEKMRGTIAQRRAEPSGHHMSQKDFVERGGVDLVLYFERLPQCLGELPFVDKSNIPPFPHNNAGGFRPAQGNFFDFFTMEDEKLIWQYDREDFETFGYQRFDCGLPAACGNCMRLTSKADSAGGKDNAHRREKR